MCLHTLKMHERKKGDMFLRPLIHSSGIRLDGQLMEKMCQRPTGADRDCIRAAD